MELSINKSSHLIKIPVLTKVRAKSVVQANQSLNAHTFKQNINQLSILCIRLHVQNVSIGNKK